MNREERMIYKERIDDMYEEIEKSWDTFADGVCVTTSSIARENPDFITRMNLTCDNFMTETLVDQLNQFRDLIKEIKSEFTDEDDNADE